MEISVVKRVDGMGRKTSHRPSILSIHSSDHPRLPRSHDVRACCPVAPPARVLAEYDVSTGTVDWTARPLLRCPQAGRAATALLTTPSDPVRDLAPRVGSPLASSARRVPYRRICRRAGKRCEQWDQPKTFPKGLKSSTTSPRLALISTQAGDPALKHART